MMKWIVLISVLGLIGCGEEPSYQGATVSEWIKVSHDLDRDVADSARDPLFKLGRESKKAMERWHEMRQHTVKSYEMAFNQHLSQFKDSHNKDDAMMIIIFACGLAEEIALTEQHRAEVDALLGDSTTSKFFSELDIEDYRSAASK